MQSIAQTTLTRAHAQTPPAASPPFGVGHSPVSPSAGAALATVTARCRARAAMRSAQRPRRSPCAPPAARRWPRRGERGRRYAAAAQREPRHQAQHRQRRSLGGARQRARQGDQRPRRRDLRTRGEHDRGDRSDLLVSVRRSASGCACRVSARSGAPASARSLLAFLVVGRLLARRPRPQDKACNPLPR